MREIQSSRGRLHRRTELSLSLLLVSFSFLAPSPASAHGGAGVTEGYVIVQQALGHLAHDTSKVGIMLAMSKLNEFLKNKDQDGVDVATVREGMMALDAGRVEEARNLLQSSIKVALSNLKPPVGEDTGTKLVLKPLLGRGNLTNDDWILMGASLLLLLAGGALAFKFRPADSVRELRQQLSSVSASGPNSQSNTPKGRDA
jgi:predicted transcriptional regulator